MRRRKRSSLARSSLWSNETTEDEVADGAEAVIVEEIAEAVVTDVETVGKLVVIAGIAILMTGRSVVRMIVPAGSETTARTTEAGAETIEEVVETDVTIGAMTEIGSGKIRRRPTRRRSSLTTLQSRLRIQAPLAPSVLVRRRQERRSQPRKSTSSPTHDTRISLISVCLHASIGAVWYSFTAGVKGSLFSPTATVELVIVLLIHTLAHKAQAKGNERLYYASNGCSGLGLLGYDCTRCS